MCINGGEKLDNKSLFYKSQAKIAELIDQLDELKSNLILFMKDCEKSVTESDDLKEMEE